ncbi:MAG: recombinase family protein [Spirochaetaceae bacterium]|nr:recombinase family protein [Spirochaetaceae bacterium]
MSIDIEWSATKTPVKAKLKDEKAVVYARFSSHSQGEQSIEGQLAAARAYAAARGYTIIHEYIDRAMTGKNDNRDDFQKMLTDCAKKQFTVIIVWKVDRFGRNREEITFNKYRAKKHGVRVEYVAENLPDSPEAVILESVLEGMAEYYSLQLSQNIRRGYRENAKKCKYAGGRIPLGYKLDDNKMFMVDEETAPIVRLIFKMYAEGKTIQEVIDHLNAQGLKTSVGQPFTKNSLRTVLKNEKYIGIFDFKNGEIRIEGGVPPIVDDTTFLKVQKLLQINQRAPASKWTRAEYLLTGKLFCGSCGSLMTGESGTSKTGAKHNYYLCGNHKKRNKTCSRKAIRQDWIEEYVLSQAQMLLKDDVLMEFIAENTWQYYLAQDERQERIKAIQHQLDDVNRSISNIMRAIEAGIFNDATKERMDELSVQKTALSAAISGIELEDGFRLTKDHIVFFLEQFKNLDYSDKECQHRLVEVFVNSIFVYDDHITINFNFGGDGRTVTFSDMEKLKTGGVFVHRALCSTITRADELCIIWYCFVFAINVEIPQRK